MSIKSIDLSFLDGSKSHFNKIRTWRAFRKELARKEKKKKERQEHFKWKRDNPFDRLCASGIDPFEYLSELAKGEHFHDGCKWFYGTFLEQERRMGVYAPKSIEEVLERLRGAWWVEKEDVLQQLHLFIVQYGINTERGPRNIINALTRPLRDWLVAQRVFNRPFFDGSRLIGYEYIRPCFLPTKIKQGTLYERYVLWLQNLDLTKQERKEILGGIND